MLSFLVVVIYLILKTHALKQKNIKSKHYIFERTRADAGIGS